MDVWLCVVVLWRIGDWWRSSNPERVDGPLILVVDEDAEGGFCIGGGGGGGGGGATCGGPSVVVVGSLFARVVDFVGVELGVDVAERW